MDGFSDLSGDGVTHESVAPVVTSPWNFSYHCFHLLLLGVGVLDVYSPGDVGRWDGNKL